MKCAILLVQLFLLAAFAGLVVWAVSEDQPLFATGLVVVCIACATAAWFLAKRWPVSVNIALALALLVVAALMFLNPPAKEENAAPALESGSR